MSGSAGLGSSRAPSLWLGIGTVATPPLKVMCSRVAFLCGAIKAEAPVLRPVMASAAPVLEKTVSHVNQPCANHVLVHHQIA